MLNLLKKTGKIFSVAVITCMCLGCVTIFADYYNQVLTKGTNFSLKSGGESLNHFATNTNIKYVERVGANYNWKEITDNEKKNYNYVRTTVQYKNSLGKWKKLTHVDANMPTTGRIFCPRTTYSNVPTRVWGLSYWGSNNFSKNDDGYGKTAHCTTSLTQGYVYCD